VIVARRSQRSEWGALRQRVLAFTYFGGFGRLWRGCAVYGYANRKNIGDFTGGKVRKFIPLLVLVAPLL